MENQASIVQTVRLRVETALSRLSLNGFAVVAETRAAIAEARKLEGTIQDASVWQEIHTLVNKLEARLSAYQIEGLDQTRKPASTEQPEPKAKTSAA